MLELVTSIQKLSLFKRASVFTNPCDISTWTICPAHGSSLGIAWHRVANRCRFPPGLSKHALKGKVRRADHGICKSESKAILRHTGVFLSVGSGKYTLFHTYVMDQLRSGHGDCYNTFGNELDCELVSNFGDSSKIQVNARKLPPVRERIARKSALCLLKMARLRVHFTHPMSYHHHQK